jgi:hypothetical protein
MAILIAPESKLHVAHYQLANTWQPQCMSATPKFPLHHSSNPGGAPRVNLALQGGGSHGAFTCERKPVERSHKRDTQCFHQTGALNRPPAWYNRNEPLALVDIAQAAPKLGALAIIAKP